MPEITDDHFRLLVEMQNLGRIMKRCSNVREPDFTAAQSALALAINRLSSLPTVRDLSRDAPGSILA
ncbi:MAG TPA: hypothetical protein VL574_02525 [Stellaceae bacterium]|jgi:hypothetical protein|nr:hypothetical protein [Stellaceae bacterium]